MIHRKIRDYEVSVWSLQDSPIAILKPYGVEYKGQIERGKLEDKDDGTQTFSFTIPMYLIRDGKRIENPCWYNVQRGYLLADLRKIKVIFNKDAENLQDRKIYEFLIVKVSQQHKQQGQLYCDVECEGLAFHELGKIGYKISLSPEDFYNDDYDWSVNGKWYDGFGNQQITQPLATLNYWNDKVFNTISNWEYEVQMNWEGYSLQEYTQTGNLNDYTTLNDTREVITRRSSNKVYEDDFVDSWQPDAQSGKMIPVHITRAREKARVSINVHDSNIYNITQTLAETFGVFCKYIYNHDQNCRITSKKVIYYNNFLNEQQGIMDITYPYQASSITRQIDSTDIVTKLFVKQIEDSGTASGLLNIMDVGANKSKQDYILNFDYLHKIDAISDEQYEAIDKYVMDVRAINDDIAPLSAKVISLQSEIVKLEAELTTRTNAIAKDTQEIFSNHQLLDAVTSGTEILSVTERNPQTGVLVQDTSKNNNSYYIKMTQKGVYSETIKIYRKYSYTSAQLSDQITSGKIEFDEFGNVYKITNIYVGENDPTTVYLTYDYRPSLFYENIEAMWKTRLAEDTARKAYLQQELAKINYNLYGTDSKYPIANLNVKNIKQINLYGKYLNLIHKKQNIIKQFNALMGPALRQGYWQPEDYTDYGDKYNDTFNISLSNIEPVYGASGNAYFYWDDQLFDGEQKLYYEYTAAQTKIPYPCIDLSKKPEILQMIVNNPDTPISFVYMPLTATEDSVYPREIPYIDRPIDEVVLIPDLYIFSTNPGNQHKVILNPKYSSLSSYYIGENQNHVKRIDKYKGLLQYDIKLGYKKGLTYFYWQAKKSNNTDWVNITRYTLNNDFEHITQRYTFNNVEEYQDNIRLAGINTISENNDTPYLQLLSTSDHTLEGWKFRLIAGNQLGTNIKFDQNGNEIQDSVVPLPARLLGTNSVVRDEQYGQHQHLLKNQDGSFTISYFVINTHPDDLAMNQYEWTIVNHNSVSNSTQKVKFFQEEFSGEEAINDYISITQTYDEINQRMIETLTIQNNDGHGNYFLNNFSTGIPLEVYLTVRNLTNMMENIDAQDAQENSKVVGESYYCYGETNDIPWKIDNDQFHQNITSIEYNNEAHTFVLYLTVKAASSSLSFTQANWRIGNDEFASNNGFTMSTQILHESNTDIWIAKLSLEITDGVAAASYFNNKIIKCSIGNSPYYEFEPLVFTDPIVILTNQVNSPKAIFLINQSQTVTFEVSAKQATKFKWQIIPSGNGSLIEQEVDKYNTEITFENGRYKVEYKEDQNDNTIIKSILSIVIPPISDNNSNRDNNTKIKCICNNFSNAPISTNQGTISVSLPVSINVIGDTDEATNMIQWWPNLKSTQLATIQFNVPRNIIRNLNSTQQVNLMFNISQFCDRVPDQEPAQPINYVYNNAYNK